MNTRCASALCITLCLTALFTCGAYWTEKAQNPAWFPYKQGTGSSQLMDLPIPTATPGFMVSPSDPLAGVQGYWPTFYAIAVFANNKYYVGCGQGPNIALGSPAGFAWPSNSYGQGASYNRQSMMAIYDPAADTWDCSKWDQTGPVPFNYNFGSGGTAWAVIGDGTQIGAAQAFAYDYDADGTEEIYMHGGYPQWSGWNFIFDPDLNGGKGSWSTTAAASSWSIGEPPAYRCQRRGGCVLVGSNVFVIGGSFWGPPGQCNLQVFSPVANAWTVYENVYGTNIQQFGIGAVGTKVYLLGGRELVGTPTEVDILRYSPNVYMLDTTNIAAGLTKVGTLQVGIEQPSVIAWRGLLYVIAGMTSGTDLNLTSGATNLFQIFNPATGGTTLNDTPLPVNAYGASCAVSTGGILYVGGALRYVDADGTNYNSSRLWTGPLPQQDLLASPTSLNFWQTNTTLQLRLDNVAFVPIVCSNTSSVAWLSINNIVTVPNQTNIIVDVTVDHGMYAGPTNGSITIHYSGGAITVPVLADTPRPVAVLTPAATITLQPRTKSFVLGNSGAVAMAFTNTSAQAYVTDITPAIGVLAPYASTTISFTVTAAAPRPSVGTIQIAFNSYNGLADVFTIRNFPADYYVSTSGNNANDGLSWPTAWRNIAFGVTNIPNGSTEEGAVTLHVGAGTYAGESTDASGTNWIIDLSGRQFINLVGAGAEQSILTRGTKNWLISFGRDTYAEYPVIKLFESEHVRVSGFTVMGNDPPAYTDGTGVGASAPDILALVGINGGNGVRVDHMYLNGLYTGMVYNAAVSNWVDSWESWWYFGMCVDGVIGPSNAMIDHVLVRGFRNAIQNNSYPYRDYLANINGVYIDHCTFVEGLCVSEDVAAVTVKCGDADVAWHSPGFFVVNSIISEYPWSQFPGASSGFGLQSSRLQTAGFNFGLNSISNQFWSCGVPPPGVAWWNDNVFYYDDPSSGQPFDNYTNEMPVFETVGGLPYSTQLETAFGTRDVGWNVVPEPAVLGMLALAMLGLRRRR
ncbi:MAG: hypothetical protein NTV22_14605 [bacterium]|nr:hypothetical protein [bacterium]